MSWKPLAPLLALPLLILLAALVPWQPVVNTDDRIVQYSFPMQPYTPSCDQRAEVRALKQLGNPHALTNLHHALLALHDLSDDALLQPIVEVLRPKTIYLDPETLQSVEADPQAIAVNRFTRRLDLHYPITDHTGIKLSYRIGLRADSKQKTTHLEVVLDQQSQEPTAVLELQRLNDDVHLDHQHISDCAATALIQYLPHQHWVQGQSVEAGYCRLHSERMPQWRYFYPCPSMTATRSVAQ